MAARPSPKESTTPAATSNTVASSSSSSSLANLFTRRPSLFSTRHHHHHHSASNTNTKNNNTNRATAKTPGPHHHSRSRTTTPTQLIPASHQSASPHRVPSTPPRRKHASRHSLSSSVADIGSTLRRSRSASLRTTTSSGTPSSSHRRIPSATLALSFSPEKAPAPNHAPPPSRPALSISTFTRNKQKSSENVRTADASKYEKSPLSAVDNPKTPFSAMAVPVPLRHPPTQKEIQQAQRTQSNLGPGYTGGLAPAAPISVPTGVNPHIIFQQIHELASKRISTLDYLRKAHEGRIYWFNTLLFAKTDLTRLPSFTPRNLARRATNYLLLGFSLPTILDLNANSPTDYLKALNALLVEFEAYQTIHPPDGSTASSLSRGRIPQMFKRTNMLGGKGRRSSSAASEVPLLTPQNSFNDTSTSVDSPPDDVLLPNESYTYLQTPSLPFDPDFFSTFATLCDVLIDCYTKILSMLSTPESVAAAGGGAPSVVGDLFNKADARIRKIILANMVREFEESCRQGVKTEIGGVGKVVLGGLM
ncbi:uncharacterized protein EI97DRAFT_493246 [Westerdykella ornata]|uniref:Uncharacterized protein n=1 Tax=Westerdykella ornata TaxID=318751 RepID=A0A6A6JNG5_WESOR|nr:uncharacterized protein EI97DRAFT_493246 [Westerdykella ornata]KAF2278067.1 hypothetical protein EI97DRAFT_493246 [Westerdykella ornata]